MLIEREIRMTITYHPDPNHYWMEPETERDLLLEFNDLLDEEAHFFTLNENDLEGLIETLDHFVSTRDEIYWLTLARITELVLHCAGNYANSGEFALMGDLLLNPRLVLVHIQGDFQPVVKKRHTLLTDQFKAKGNSRYQVMQWLKNETIIEVKHKALLPHLIEQLEQSAFIEREYLDSIRQRTKQIADCVVFLHSILIQDNESLFSWTKKASQSDRAMIEAKLFPFDLAPFFELGQKIRQPAQIVLTDPTFPKQKTLPERPQSS
jgi:hypothetical protein